MDLKTLTVKEQIQEDLLTLFDGQSQEALDKMCEIVVNNFKLLDCKPEQKVHNLKSDSKTFEEVNAERQAFDLIGIEDFKVDDKVKLLADGQVIDEIYTVVEINPENGEEEGEGDEEDTEVFLKVVDSDGYSYCVTASQLLKVH